MMLISAAHLISVLRAGLLMISSASCFLTPAFAQSISIHLTLDRLAVFLFAIRAASKY